MNVSTLKKLGIILGIAKSVIAFALICKYDKISNLYGRDV